MGNSGNSTEASPTVLLTYQSMKSHESPAKNVQWTDGIPQVSPTGTVPWEQSTHWKVPPPAVPFPVAGTQVPRPLQGLPVGAPLAPGAVQKEAQRGSMSGRSQRVKEVGVRQLWSRKRFSHERRGGSSITGPYSLFQDRDLKRHTQGMHSVAHSAHDTCSSRIFCTVRYSKLGDGTVRGMFI